MRLIPIALVLLCACATTLEQRPGETDAEFADRQHQADVKDFQRKLDLFDISMNLLKANGAGDDEFWAKYDRAHAIFDEGFKLWKGGELTKGDAVDAAFVILKALSAELAEREEAKRKASAAAAAVAAGG